MKLGHGHVFYFLEEALAESRISPVLVFFIFVDRDGVSRPHLAPLLRVTWRKRAPSLGLLARDDESQQLSMADSTQ